MEANGSAVAPDTIERNGKQFRPVTEGKATILVPHDSKGSKDQSEAQKVFYNPIQQFNRDLSTLAVKVYGEEAVERKKQAYDALRKKKGKKRKRGEETADSNAEHNSKESIHTTATVDSTAAPDISTSTTFKPPFKILEALSASGLRALRYGHELPFVTSITANDLSPSAAASIRDHVAYNDLDSKIQVTQNDALAIMYRAIADDLSNKTQPGASDKANKWDVIDLDPYGTSAPFFDAAVQAVRDDGGLLCITCTDSAVWAGHSYCEKTFSLYGGTPIKGSHSHEAGLRLILNAVATTAARYGLDIEPLLSLSIDYYTKVFVRVQKSPHTVKFLGAKTMLVHSCDQGCGSWSTQYLVKAKAAPNKKSSGFFYKHGMAQGPTAEPFCPHCGFKTHINGPMYGGRIHSPEFVQKLLEEVSSADPKTYGTLQRLEGVLHTALEEIPPAAEPEQPVNPKEDAAAAIDPVPFYVDPGRLASIITAPAPPGEMFRGALIHLGYKTLRSHCRPGSIKTDAPWSTIWWIMVEWVRQKVPSYQPSKIKPASAGYKIIRSHGLLDNKQSDDAGADADPDTIMDATMESTASEEPTEGRADGQSNDLKVESPKQSSKHKDDAPEKYDEQELRKTLVFDENLARLGRRDGKPLVRYQANPEKNWGPLNKALSR